MAERGEDTAARAGRILDAAGTMLLRLGYRKVTIDDIAKRAGIGKGTVYLHWRTKAELFETLLRRESIGLVQEILERIEADPAEALPHRFARSSMLSAARNPLVAALFTGDPEILGSLSDSSIRGKENVLSDQYFSTMLRLGLFRDDVPHLEYSFGAASIGFWQTESAMPDEPVPDAEARADALAHVVRHAFEPAEPPTPEAVNAAATAVRAMFTDLISTYEKWIGATQQGGTP